MGMGSFDTGHHLTSHPTDMKNGEMAFFRVRPNIVLILCLADGSFINFR